VFRLVYILCETMAINACEERDLVFVPLLPVACIYAAGPELARVTPEGWGVAHWRCEDENGTIIARIGG
jgi:hypothetical protein